MAYSQDTCFRNLLFVGCYRFHASEQAQSLSLKRWLKCLGWESKEQWGLLLLAALVGKTLTPLNGWQTWASPRDSSNSHHLARKSSWRSLQHRDTGREQRTASDAPCSSQATAGQSHALLWSRQGVGYGGCLLPHWYWGKLFNSF